MLGIAVVWSSGTAGMPEDSAGHLDTTAAYMLALWAVLVSGSVRSHCGGAAALGL